MISFQEPAGNGIADFLVANSRLFTQRAILPYPDQIEKWVLGK
jgi:hypothetical protein